jgi:hypothetical protein
MITYLTGGKKVGSIGSLRPLSYDPGRAVHFSVAGATRNCASGALLPWLVVWRQGGRFAVAGEGAFRNRWPGSAFSDAEGEAGL